MAYPGQQYIDIACYTDDWPALVAEVRASDQFIEGEDYENDGDSIVILGDVADFQRNGDQTFCIIRTVVGGGTRLSTLVNFQNWGVIPVTDIHGEHLRPGGIYDLPPPRQAIIDAWPGFQKLGFMGQVLV